MEDEETDVEELEVLSANKGVRQPGDTGGAASSASLAPTQGNQEPQPPPPLGQPGDTGGLASSASLATTQGSLAPTQGNQEPPPPPPIGALSPMQGAFSTRRRRSNQEGK